MIKGRDLIFAGEQDAGTDLRMHRSLDEAFANGEPLIDLIVRFLNGVDDVAATKILNALGDDIHFHESPWYNDRGLRIGQATAEGAWRLFNTRFTRVPLDKWNPETKRHEGYSSEYFRWSQTAIERWPEELSGLVASIGMTQPGANDNFQPYIPLNDRD